MVISISPRIDRPRGSSRQAEFGRTPTLSGFLRRAGRGPTQSNPHRTNGGSRPPCPEPRRAWAGGCGQLPSAKDAPPLVPSIWGGSCHWGNPGGAVVALSEAPPVGGAGRLGRAGAFRGGSLACRALGASSGGLSLLEGRFVFTYESG